MYIAETALVQGHTKEFQVLTWLSGIKFNEIYIHNSDVQSMFFVENDINWPNGTCTGIHKSISIHYVLWRKIL